MGVREEIDERFRANLARVRGLVEIHEAEATRGDRPASPHLSDLLRAAVVLMHATLEDLVRSLAEWKLPTAPAGSLERIMIACAGKPKERVFLVDLAELRGQTVDSVITRSIEAHLARSSYNHPGDVAELLAKIELKYEIDGPTRNSLAAMMSRRHQIAHRADRDPTMKSGPPTVVPIPLSLVERWFGAVEGFAEGLLAQV